MESFERCPWCGRPISVETATNVRNYSVTRKVIRCGHCSKLVIVSMGGRRWYFAFTFLAFALIRYPIAMIIILLALTGLYLFFAGRTKSFSLARCDESQKPILFDGETYVSRYDSEIKLVKGDILLTDKNYDAPSLSERRSPIAVLDIDKRNRVIRYCFLYHNPENVSLLSSAATVYKNATPIRLTETEREQ